MSRPGDRVVVIGGGVIGLSCAVELADAGLEVTVIDRHDMTAGASCGNAGLIAMGHPPLPRPGLVQQSLQFLLDPTSPLYIPFRLDPSLWRWLWAFRKACSQSQFNRSMTVLASLSRLSAERFHGYARDPEFEFEFHGGGLLDVCLTESGMEHLVHDAELIASHGFRFEVLDGRALRQAEPTYLDHVLGGIRYPESASASPGQFIRALRRRAEQRGVSLRPGQAVTAISTSGSRVRSVNLESGESLKCDQLIMAAGIWTTRLAAMLGVKVPMQAAKGYHVNLTMDGLMPTTAGVLSETFIAATPMDGGLRLAGTLEFSGINHAFRRRRVEMLTTGARRYIRGIDDAQMTSAWCGLRPCTADGLPVISTIPGIDNAIVATGHAMLGFGLGPATGIIVRQMVLGEESAFDLEPLSVTRFN